MKVEYIREINKEKCILHSENKIFLMSVKQREVKLNFNKKKYIKCKIKLCCKYSFTMGTQYRLLSIILCSE